MDDATRAEIMKYHKSSIVNAFCDAATGIDTEVILKYMRYWEVQHLLDTKMKLQKKLIGVQITATNVKDYRTLLSQIEKVQKQLGELLQIGKK